MSDDKKKPSVKPVNIPFIKGDPSPFKRTYDDSVVLSNGMSMEELAKDPELLEAYTKAQNRLYVQRLNKQKENEARGIDND